MAKDMKRILEQYERIVAWGTGDYYIQYRHLLKDRLSYIIDNNPSKQGTILDGLTIYSPQKLKEENPKSCLIVVFNTYFEEISTETAQYGEFDVIDILAIDIALKREADVVCVPSGGENERPVLVCGGLHALWKINGARKFIDSQKEILRKNGHAILEIMPLPYCKAGENGCNYLAVSYDMAYLGIMSVEELAASYPIVNGMIVHSLYYGYEVLEDIFSNISVENRILYYLHDYYCICNQRFLHFKGKLCLKNKLDLQCTDCENRYAQKRIYDFHNKLFQAYQVILIAPSQDTADRVQYYYRDAQIEVLPHLTYQEEEMCGCGNRKKRIAYLGGASWMKGWNGFCHVVEALKDKYEFFCMGKCDKGQRIENVTYVDVTLEQGGEVPIMVDALRKYHIDIAYIGSIWPETYSYTYFEAYEAGCFVITNELSGNVCNQVRENQNGKVFLDVSEMIVWLENAQEVTACVEKSRKRITQVEDNGEFIRFFQN